MKAWLKHKDGVIQKHRVNPRKWKKWINKAIKIEVPASYVKHGLQKELISQIQNIKGSTRPEKDTST